MRKFSFLLLLVVLPLALSADDAVSGLVITKTNGEVVEIYTPLNYPDPAEIQLSEEPRWKSTRLNSSHVD